ncbi:uromodulin-like [Petromyzon marinus]|uniref:uromodulin-like n=1 Tax=Petromyzon marinus TaxID=7757 RepID=UPI003F6F1D5F
MAPVALALLFAVAFATGASAQDALPAAINSTAATQPLAATNSSTAASTITTSLPTTALASSSTAVSAITAGVTKGDQTARPVLDTHPACLPGVCQNGGLCGVTPQGSYVCTCFHGYTGRNCSEVSLRVDCGASEVSASLENDFLAWHNITATTVVLARHSSLDAVPSEACLARKSVSQGVSHLLMKQTHGREECGAKMMVNDTHVNIAYQVIIGNRSDVIERIYFVLDFSCVYPLEERVASDVAVTSALLTFIIPEMDGVLRVAMALYRSANFSQADRYAVSPRLSSFDRIYVRVFLHMHSKDKETDAKGDFNLLLVNCWCTPSDNASDPINHKLFNDGCPSDQTAYFHSVNGNDSHVDFSVQMLKFIGIQYQLVYIHCSVRVCFSVNSTQCVPGCQGGRVKRHTRKADTFEGVLSIGPMRIVDDEVEIEVTQSTHGLSTPILVPLLLVAAFAGALVSLGCFVATRRGTRQLRVAADDNLGGQPPSYGTACGPPGNLLLPDASVTGETLPKTKIVVS